MKKVILAIIIFGSLNGINAQTIISSKKKTSTAIEPIKESISKTVNIKFTLEMLADEKINPLYKGYSILEVVEPIERMTNISKGEFETTDEFNIRKKNILNEKFLDASSLDDIFAFKVNVSKGSNTGDGFKYEFDADTSLVNLFTIPNLTKNAYLNGIGGPINQTRKALRNMDQFIIERKLISEKTYDGTNDYGAVISVTESKLLNTGIATNRLKFLNFSRGTGYSSITPVAQFKLDNIRAANELPSLQALIIFKPAEPYIAYNFDYKKPTRSSPTDIVINEKYLVGDILGVIFYSGKNGEIFGRVPEDFGKLINK